MSSYYGLIVSEVGHYDYYRRNSSNILKNREKQFPVDDVDALPPSYSAVLAEKYQQQTWDTKLVEMNDMLKCMKKSIQEDTQLMMKSFHYCCQTLEFKNQYLLTKLEQEIVSISEIDTTSFDAMLSQSDQVYKKDANDSLTRMNRSLEKLIEEAEMSLNSRLSLHADPLRRSCSCPRFTNTSTDNTWEYENNLMERERQVQLQQQKKRYFHSQWKLAIAMKQFVQTVQNTTNQINKQESHNFKSLSQVQIIHHIHHHYHHVIHHYKNTTSIQEGEVETTIIAESKPQEDTALSLKPAISMLPSNASLTFLFKYALHTIVGIIPPQQAFAAPTTILRSVKFQTMFMATVLVLQKFNQKSIWINRGNLLLNRWNQKSKQQCHFWVKKSQLLLFIIHLLAIYNSNYRP